MPFLYRNPNRHAPVRANGVRFWGHPQRGGAIRYIVLHTAESAPRYTQGNDAGAENVAAYLSRVTRPASYHRIGDSDSTVTLLPDEAVAFGASGANTHGWQWSWATQAWRWPGKPRWWRDAALELAAVECARVATDHDIPVTLLSRAAWLAGGRGFTYHGYVDPGRRTDPGITTFPWPRFRQMVAAHMGRPEHQEVADVMQFGDAGNEVAWLQGELNRYQALHGQGGGKPLAVNGQFDAATRARVRSLQRSWAWAETGVVDLPFMGRLGRNLSVPR